MFVVDGFSSRPMRKSHSSFDAFTAFTCNRFGTKLEHISNVILQSCISATSCVVYAVHDFLMVSEIVNFRWQLVGSTHLEIWRPS